MKKNVKQFLCLFLALFAITGVSCGVNERSVDEETTAAAAVTTAVDAVDEGMKYPSEIANYDGYEFRILNVIDDMWDTSIQILDLEEESGESISSAIYKRKRKVEEEMGIKISVVKKDDIFKLVNHLNISVSAGEDAYDAAYVCTQSYSAAKDSVYNLYDINTINLNEVWWDPSYSESMSIDGKLYGGMEYCNFWGQIFIAFIPFNRGMMNDLNLDLPYNLVENGEWTYDKMYEYMVPVVTLNSEDSFKPTLNDTCVYGLISNHNEAGLTLFQGSGQSLVVKDKNGMPAFVENQDTFITAYDKLCKIFSEDGFYDLINTAELIGTDIFWNGRAMFSEDSIGCLLGGVARESEVEYGVLPMPKYSEAQENYFTPISQYGMVVTIPKTNNDAERTGAILDYMSFCGYTDVYPVVSEMLCYKGLRDDESIKMIDIIYSTKFADIGFLWGWTTGILNSLADGVYTSKANVTSLVESQATSIKTVIEKYIDEETKQ